MKREFNFVRRHGRTVPAISLRKVGAFPIGIPVTSPGMTESVFADHRIVGMENSAPSFVPDGQREVTVLVLV
jgi:hypothetical protein